jgi:hypothetical protein
MRINLGKSKAIRFTRAQVKEKNHYMIPLGTKKFQKRAVANTWE